MHGFCLELEAKDVAHQIKGKFSEVGSVYARISDFMADVAKTYMNKVSDARSKINDIEFQRLKHHKRAIKKSKAMTNKVRCNLSYYFTLLYFTMICICNILITTT